MDASVQTQLINGLITALASIATVAIPLIVKAGLDLLKSRLQIEVSAATEQRLTDAAQRGVAIAEEKAHQAAKVGTPLTSEEKQAIAQGHVEEVLRHHGLGRVPASVITNAIDAAVHDFRTYATKNDILKAAAAQLINGAKDVALSYLSTLDTPAPAAHEDEHEPLVTPPPVPEGAAAEHTVDVTKFGSSPASTRPG